MQADVVLERQLRALHLAGNRKLTETLDCILSIANLKAHPHSDTFPPTRPCPHNKGTPPNSATPCEIIGANYIQTITPLTYNLSFGMQWLGICVWISVGPRFFVEVFVIIYILQP